MRVIISKGLRIIRNTVIVLFINVSIAFLIWYLFKLKSSYNFGLALGAIGVLYLLPLAGSFNGNVEQKTSYVFNTARTVSSVGYEERNKIDRDLMNNDLNFSLKLLIYGLATIAMSYPLIMEIIKF